MAFQQAVSKPVPYQTNPLVYPDAYWVASFQKLDKVSQTAIVVFSAYANKAAREAGNIQPVATHSFTVTGPAFNTYFSLAASGSPPIPTNVYAQAYVMAKATADPVQRVANGKTAAPKIFFANAVNV